MGKWHTGVKPGCSLHTGRISHGSSGGRDGLPPNCAGFIALLTDSDGIAIGGLVGSGYFGKVFEGVKTADEDIMYYSYMHGMRLPWNS